MISSKKVGPVSTGITTWNAATGKKTGGWALDDLPTARVVAAGADERVIVAGGDIAIYRWNGQPVHRVELKPGSAWLFNGAYGQGPGLVDVSPDGHLAAVFRVDPTRIELISVVDGRVVQTIRPSVNTTRDGGFTPDGSRFGVSMLMPDLSLAYQFWTFAWVDRLLFQPRGSLRMGGGSVIRWAWRRGGGSMERVRLAEGGGEGAEGVLEGRHLLFEGCDALVDCRPG